MMRLFPHRGSPDGSLPGQPDRGHARPRKVLAPGAVIATVAAMGALAAAGPAHAALPPGASLKTLAAGQGNRYFGSAMGQSLLSNTTATQLQAQQFNMLTPANEMKWDTTEPGNGQFNFAPGDTMVSYAKANGERVRCHNLVWHSQLPSWVASSLPVSQVQATMENHITTEATHFKGQCYAWDVVNEPLNEDGTPRADVFFNAMGIGYIADALKTARAADPASKLYLNDFDIEGMNAKSNAMFSLAQSLLAANVPLDGIGFESHFIVGQVPSDMQANMQRFANLGLDVAVTELDDRITTPASAANLQQQATDFASVVKACLGVTRCVGVSASAVGDADSTIPLIYAGQGAATMFDVNYNPKPAFFAVQAALGGSNALTLTNPGPQHGIVGVPVTPVTLTASDPNPGAALAWTESALPAGLALTVSGSSATISGTPTAADIGTSNVVITVLDSTGATASASFPWTITAPTLTITNPGPQHGIVGVPLSITLTATDSNPAATITWSMTGLPAGLAGLTLGSSGASTTLSGAPTVTGTASLTVTATDSTGASASVSFTLTITAPAQTASCHVTYAANNYPGGFTANITLANTGTTAINGWTLQFTFPGDQKITSTWNGTTTQSGQNVSIVNMSYNASIPANGSTTLGFQGTWTSSNTSPASFTVNGAACT